MDKIDAIIVKCQNAHKTSAPLMQQGEPWQSASEPQGGLADKHDKGVMRTLWVSQQYSSHDDNHCHKKHQLPQCKCHKRNQKPGGPLNGNVRQVGQIHASDLSWWERWDQQKIRNKELAKNNKKYSHVTLAPHVMHVTLAGWVTQTIDWHHPEQQWNKRELWWQQWRQKLPSSFW